MTWFESLLLGILQGLTEFLPVSSSGHLTIGQELLNLDTSAADNLLFTVTVHAATVLSTIVILWKEIENLFKGTFFTTKWNAEKEYVSKILLSCVPVMIVGLFFKDYVEQIFGSGLLLVGCCLLLTATLLTFAYYAKPRNKEDISYRDAFIIGLSQAVAVLPGLGQQSAVVIVAEADMVAVAVGLLLQVAVGVIGIAVAYQCAAADGDAASQSEIPIAEAVGGAGCLDGRQQVVGIGILR